MSEVTQILAAVERGDPIAADKLMPLVYDELRYAFNRFWTLMFLFCVVGLGLIIEGTGADHSLTFQVRELARIMKCSEQLQHESNFSVLIRTTLERRTD